MSILKDVLKNVPVEWKSLHEIADLYGGLNGKNKTHFTDGNAKYVTYKNVYNNIEVDFNSLELVKIGVDENQSLVKYGDILFTGSSENANDVGMSCAVTTKADFKIYLNSFSFGLRFKSDIQLLPEFAKYLFRSKLIRDEISKTASGVTRYNISKKRFVKIQIPIPYPDDPGKSITIQQEIVSMLDRLSEQNKALTIALAEEITNRKKQYEYYREELFHFEGKEVEWKTLGEIGDVKMCKRIFKKETYDKGDIPFYKIGTFGKKPDAFISKELFELYVKKYSFPKKGDILISASGTIGRTVVYNGAPSYFQDSNIIWIANTEELISNSYLFHFYKIAKWYVSDGGTIDRLYNDNVRKTKIPIPFPKDLEKSLKEQKRIVAILDKFDEATKGIVAQLENEIDLRNKQYEYYRNQLLTFNDKN